MGQIGASGVERCWEENGMVGDDERSARIACVLDSSKTPPDRKTILDSAFGL
jgi:hypothetical protein